MSDFDYIDPKRGPTMVFTEDEIVLRGTTIPVIEVIEAAFQWKKCAKARRWRLKDSNGHVIKMKQPHWKWD